MSEGPPEDVGELDPFGPHLAFAARWGPDHAAFARPRVPIEPFEPLDTRVDGLVDLEALEALTQWIGVVKHGREMSEDEYPVELADALANKQPQFILRNIPRAERWADPNDPLGLERSKAEYGLNVPGATEARGLTYEPLELIEKFNGAVLADERALTRRMFREMPWEESFGHEVKQDLDGPIWRHQTPAVRRALGLEPEPEDEPAGPGSEAGA